MSSSLIDTLRCFKTKQTDPCKAIGERAPHGDTDLPINSRTLVDLRAGIQFGDWRIWAWGQNVTDKHYWNQVAHVNDVMLRFTGMPETYGLTVSFRPGS